MQAELHNAYKKASYQLRSLARSERKIKILMTLNEGPKDLCQLRDLLFITSSSIIHTMRDMEAEGLIVTGAKECYALTNVGKILAIVLNDLVKAMGVFSKDIEFWLAHDIGGIPDPLLKRIGNLIDFTFLGKSKANVLKTHLNVLQLLTKAKKLKCVAPIFYPDYPDLIEKLINEKSDVQIVVTDDVLNMMFYGMYHRLSKDILFKQNFKLWVIKEDIKEAFAVTDTAFAFGLFRDDGTYDTSTGLVSYTDEALNWGKNLFRYYRNQAMIIKPEDV